MAEVTRDEVALVREDARLVAAAANAGRIKRGQLHELDDGDEGRPAGHASALGVTVDPYPKDRRRR